MPPHNYKEEIPGGQDKFDEEVEALHDFAVGGVPCDLYAHNKKNRYREGERASEGVS